KDRPNLFPTPRPRISAFAHLGPGGFENPLFTFGQALDALRRDFVEDRIDFFAEKFIRGQIFFYDPFVAAPARFLRMNFDQSSKRSTGAPIELRPLKMPMHRILNENKPSQNPAQVSNIGHLRTESASVRQCDAPSGEHYAHPEQVLGPHWNEHEQHQDLVGKQERKCRCDAEPAGGCAHNTSAKSERVVLQSNRIGKHASERLAQSADNSAREIQSQKALAAQGLFNGTSQKENYQTIARQMQQICMEKLKRQQLPHVSVL